MMCLLHDVAKTYACRMYKDINPFGVRFPAELREKIEKSAEANHRSMNAEIVLQLLEAYRERNALAHFSDGELIDELLKRGWGRERFSIQDKGE